MLNRRNMLTVCGATVATVAISGKAANASPVDDAFLVDGPIGGKVVTRAGVTANKLTDQEYFSEYGQVWMDSHPKTKNGRLLCDFGVIIQEFISEHYPGGKVSSIEELKLFIDFDNNMNDPALAHVTGTPVIRQHYCVGVTPCDSDTVFKVSGSLTQNLEFFRTMHVMASEV